MILGQFLVILKFWIFFLKKPLRSKKKLHFLTKSFWVLGQFFLIHNIKLCLKKTVLAHRIVYLKNVIFFKIASNFFQGFSIWIILPYLGQKAKNEENKNTFFSSTLKVWENKVPLFLVFLAYLFWIWPFYWFWGF